MKWSETHWLRELLGAGNPREVLLVLLRTGSLLLNAQAATFTPATEWQPHLPPLALGMAPVSLAQLREPAVRFQCRVCNVLHGGEDCPLLNGLEAPPGLWCLPLDGEEGRLGVANFFLPAERRPTEDAMQHLARLQRDACLALRGWRHTRSTHWAQNPQPEVALTDFLQAGIALLGCQRAAFYTGMLNGGRIVWAGEGPEDVFLPTVAFWRELRTLAATPESCRRLASGGWLCAFATATEGEILALHWPQEAAPSAAWRAQGGSLARLLGHWLQGETQLAARMAAAAATERRYLAREIHDGLAQTLAYLRIEAERIRKMLQRGQSARAATTIEQILAGLDEANRGLRLELSSLRSAARPVPFAQWLRDLDPHLWQRFFASEAALDVQVHVRRPLPLWMTPHLQRITQEAIANACRHAQANQIWVVLKETKDAWELTIRDDGRGCDVETASMPGHFGWLGMQERARALSGTLTINSQPGEGLQIRLRIPFAAAEAEGGEM